MKCWGVRMLALSAAAGLLAACTQEQQNKLGREIQNWTGTNGVLEVYAGDKLVRRFLRIDKISTALGTDDGKPRAYRYGYGVLDENLRRQLTRMTYGSLCAMGGMTAYPVTSALKHFPADFGLQTPEADQ